MQVTDATLRHATWLVCFAKLLNADRGICAISVCIGRHIAGSQILKARYAKG